MNIRIVVFAMLSSCSSARLPQDNSFHPEFKTTLDPAIGLLLMQTCSRVPPTNISDYWTPAESEILQLESTFKSVHTAVSPYGGRPGTMIEDLGHFGFQFMGVTKENKRFIYVNAFRIDQKSIDVMYLNWKKEPVRFCDGGVSYWGVLFDLQTSKFVELSFNGP